MSRGRRVLGLLASFALCGSGAIAQTRETEPNNSAATANAATLGGKASGTLLFWPQNPAVDDPDDWWVLDVTAGQTIFVDVDANEFGSIMDPGIALYAADGATQLAASGNWDGLDPYLAYVAPTSGKYYLRIGIGPHGSTSVQPYTIKFTEARCPVSSEEPEPNDTKDQALPIALGQSVHGYICPTSDQLLGNVDFFKVQVPAGTKLEVRVDTVGRTRPSFGCACQITAYFSLIAPDGRTSLAQTQEHDYPKRIEYQVTAGGTYYIAVNMFPGGLRYPYTLSTRAMSAPPGDPPVARADGLGEAWGLLADPYGDFIVSDRLYNRVWWVTVGGKKQVITNDVPHPGGLGWDAFANLLIASPDAVYKLAPDGKVSRFIDEAGINWMAVALDGTIWLTDASPSSLRHYDPFGKLLETIEVSVGNGLAPYQVAIAPSGDVYFSTNEYQSERGITTRIYRLVGNQAREIVRHDAGVWGFTLDVDGNFYISTPNMIGLDSPHNSGRVYLYDRNGQSLAAPFATGFNGPTGIAFGRNNDGSMSSRLFVVERDGGTDGRLLELNPASIRARGAAIGYATSAQAISDLLKSGGALTDVQRQFMDNIGNKNGRYDVGDLRAFLIQTITLSPGAPFGAGEKP